MYKSILIFFILSAILLTGCNCTTTQQQQSTSTPPVSTSSDPAPTPDATEPEQTPKPPITVDLDYFGIKSTHRGNEPVPPKIQLYVVVDDGKTKRASSFPPNNQGMAMDDFHLEDLTETGEIFRTSEIGDYLKISVLAYSSEDVETKLAMWKMIEAFNPSIGGTLKQLYEQLPKKQILIGYYDYTWYPQDNWGISPGKYESIGTGDLKLWFRIWSETETNAISKPVFLPDVQILKVSIPSQVKKIPDNLIMIPAEYMYRHSLTVMNNESMDIQIDWRVHSSAKGKDFDQGSTIIVAGDQANIVDSYFYKNAPGNVTITYTISYRGIELDTWSGIVNVVP